MNQKIKLSIRDFRYLAPHKQLNQGLLMFFAVFMFLPILMFAFQLNIALWSLGTRGGGGAQLFEFLYITTLILVFCCGVIWPLARLIKLNLKYSKFYGRGDEVLIFLIGLIFNILTIPAYKYYNHSVDTDTLNTLPILLFLSTLIFGIGLNVLGVFLMSKVSKKVNYSS